MRKSVVGAMIAALIVASAATAGNGWLLKPGSRGVRVKDAQWAMSGHNVFHLGTYRGKITGRYDTATQLATRKTKYRLGYPQDAVDRFYGPTLRSYLIGARKLPRSFEALKRKRWKAMQPKPVSYSYPLAVRAPAAGCPYCGTHRLGNWESDRAYDLMSRIGTKVLSVANGYIERVRPTQCPTFACRFYGWQIWLDARAPSGNRFDEFFYTHLEGVVPGLHAGQKVRAGQLLGYSGAANSVPHLHFAERYGNLFQFLALTQPHPQPAVRASISDWPWWAVLAGFAMTLTGGGFWHSRRMRKLEQRIHHEYHSVSNTTDDSGL